MPTLAEIVLEGGRQRAESMRRLADIEAERGTRNAAIWGNTIASLGSTAAQAVADYRGQKQQAPLIAARTAEVTSQTAERDAKAQAEQQRKASMGIIRGSFVPTDDGGFRLDLDKARQDHEAAGLPFDVTAVAPVLAAFDQINTSRQAQTKAGLQKLAEGVELAGLTPESLQTALSLAVMNHYIDAETASAINKRAEADPSSIKTIVDRIRGKEPAKPKFGTRSADQDIYSEDTGEVVTPGTPKVPAPPTQLELDKQAEIERHNRAMETKVAQGSTSPVAVMKRDGSGTEFVTPQEAIGRTPASSREQGRPVTSGDAGRLAEYNTSLDDLKVLSLAVSGVDATGIEAQIGAKVPNWATNLTGWGTEAKSKQAVIDRVKQVIGKALEGGVLRKEDEYKYEKILPTIGDPPAVVKTKLAGLNAAITQRRQRDLEALEDAGYDTSKFRARDTQAKDPLGIRK